MEGSGRRRRRRFLPRLMVDPSPIGYEHWLDRGVPCVFPELKRSQTSWCSARSFPRARIDNRPLLGNESGGVSRHEYLDRLRIATCCRGRGRTCSAYPERSGRAGRRPTGLAKPDGPWARIACVPAACRPDCAAQKADTGPGGTPGLTSAVSDRSGRGVGGGCHRAFLFATGLFQR